MSNNSIPEDSGPVEAGNAVEQRTECYRCGNLYPKDKLKLHGFLCDSCFDDMRALGRTISQSDSVKSKRTQVYRITEGDDASWAIYTTNGDDIKEIVRNFERNLIPVTAWEIQTQQRTAYLLMLGDITDRSVPLLMEHIDPKVHTTNIKRIVTCPTPDAIATCRALSNFILGSPCGNKLELSISEVEDIMFYINDLEKAGLRGLEITKKVLARFFVSDPITRRRHSSDLCAVFSPDFIKEALDQVSDQNELGDDPENPEESMKTTEN